MEQVFKETIKTDYKWCTLEIKVKFFKIHKLLYTSIKFLLVNLIDKLHDSNLTLSIPRPHLTLLTPKRDQHLISPYNITPESNINVMRIKEMITN